MGDKKLFFFDIDGTIKAEEDGIIPESAVESIHALREKGHRVFINTGRTSMYVRDEIRSIGFDGYVFGCGTEVILDGKRIFRTLPDSNSCRILAEEVRKCGAYPVYERSDAMFYDSWSCSNEGLQLLMGQFERDGVVPCDMNGSEDFSFDKFVIWYDENTDLESFRRLIEGRFRFVDRGHGFAEMVPLGCSKAVGMEKILIAEECTREDTVAFGDSLNDSEMLEFAGLGIAMGGAESLYPYADYITKSLKEDGIAYALKEKGFI
ncbi:MAG: HAD hydrolase family protein [Ruminococcus sp.]